MTNPKKIISPNKTFGSGDEGTVQYVIAGATLTVPNDTTHNFSNDTEIPIFLTTKDTVTVGKESGVTLTVTGVMARFKLAILKKTASNTWTLKAIQANQWLTYGGMAI